MSASGDGSSARGLAMARGAFQSASAAATTAASAELPNALSSVDSFDAP